MIRHPRGSKARHYPRLARSRAGRAGPRAEGDGRLVTLPPGLELPSLLASTKGGNLAPTIVRQIGRRGWSPADLQSTIKAPFTTRPATDKANGHPATAFFNKDGSYVVRDNPTGDFIQVSDRNDPGWLPDSSIFDPCRPGNTRDGSDGA